MNLIYSHSYASARAFALRNELSPGDWKWIHDAEVVRHNPRADEYKVQRWEANPQREKIDLAIKRAAESHRLGTLVEVGSSTAAIGMGQ